MPVLRAFVLLLLLPVPPGFAQSNETPQPSPMKSAPAIRARRMPAPRQTPCWRKAGIAPELINQQWKINDDAHGKIGAVCSDPALAAEQKQVKIHEIDQQKDREIAKLIPSTELESYRACQAERAGTKRIDANEKQLGPCGGVIPSTSVPSNNPHEAHDHRAETFSPMK